VIALLESPRRRRRLARLGLLLVVFAVAAAILVLDPGATDPVKDGPLTRTPEPAAAPEKPLRITPAMRREIDRTVHRFVGTAVVRRNLDAAWELASPTMREGVTRRDWRRGDLPVLPYPEQAIENVDWNVGYSFDRTVGIDVMVVPKAGSGESVLVYAAELTETGAGSSRRWLVDSWIPRAVLGQATAPARRGDGQGGRTEGTEAARPPLAFDDARLSAWWFLAPGLFLALLLLVPIVLVVRSVRARRRADRTYREWSGAR
jgi:hypothetical protein